MRWYICNSGNISLQCEEPEEIKKQQEEMKMDSYIKRRGRRSKSRIKRAWFMGRYTLHLKI